MTSSLVEEIAGHPARPTPDPAPTSVLGFGNVLLSDDSAGGARR